jgi:hypothetical protein
LHDAGLSVQVAAGADPRADMILRQLTLDCERPQAGLISILRHAGLSVPDTGSTPDALYKTEREALDHWTLIPLVYLPRSYATGGRVRNLRLGPDGAPDIADASLEDAP